MAIDLDKEEIDNSTKLIIKLLWINGEIQLNRKSRDKGVYLREETEANGGGGEGAARRKQQEIIREAQGGREGAAQRRGARIQPRKRGNSETKK